MSMNPIMADAESNTKSQQKPDHRPKNHPPRETILQVIGDLFQPFKDVTQELLAVVQRTNLRFDPFIVGDYE